MKPCSHDSHAVFNRLIEPLRETAHKLGYALAVHGSLVRDIDLIACPWTRDAVPANELAEAIGRKAEEVIGTAFLLPHETDDYFLAGCPGAKAHQRLGWTFHLGGGPYIDLAVMPRVPDIDMMEYARNDGNAKAPKISERWRTMWRVNA